MTAPQRPASNSDARKRAEAHTAEKDARAACGATIDHDWHGFRSDDGMHQVCDGTPRVIPPGSDAAS